MFIGQFQHVLFDLQVYKNLNSISHTTRFFIKYLTLSIQLTIEHANMKEQKSLPLCVSWYFQLNVDYVAKHS